MGDSYSGGYFLIRAHHPGWPQLETDLMPDKLISLSTCVSPRLDITWGWQPGSREKALEFGIAETRLDEFVAWCQHGYTADAAVPGSMFNSTETARRFVRRFMPDTSDLHLVGVGLPTALLDDFEPDDYAVAQRIGQQMPLEPGGTPLGYEIASYTYGDFGHSWVCAGLYVDMHDVFGIRPNGYGLIDTYTEAKQVYDWIEKGDILRRPEPEPYYAWLLVSYAVD